VTMKPSRNTSVEINRQALIANYRALKSLSGRDEFFCPMIKCNAYGHGAVRVGRWLFTEGVSCLGVALIEEALELRQAGLTQVDIFVFGIFHRDAARVIIDQNLVPVISTFEEIEYLRQALRRGETLKVHIKIDTGMRRLGFQPSQILDVRRHFEKASGLRLSGLCTHLVSGDDVGCQVSRSALQLEELFAIERLLGTQTLVKHALNSAGLINRSFSSEDDSSLRQYKGLGSRPGIALYGGFDSRDCVSEAGKTWVDSQLQPVMTLAAELIMIRDLKKGESVSYGGTWEAGGPARIGVVSVGYGDGYRRAFSNRGKFLVGRHTVPVIGRVCMDYTMIDLSSLAEPEQPKVGDQLVIFGDSTKLLRAVDLAQDLDTISYEIMTGITARVPRREVE
jgi:alanine racemase